MDVLTGTKLRCSLSDREPSRVSDSDAIVWQRNDVARPVASVQKLHDMALFVLGWGVCYFVFRLVDRKQIFCGVLLPGNFGEPRARRSTV